MYSPWEYEEKYQTERASQIALFQWSAMATTFGLKAADYPDSYRIKGEATRLAANPIPQLKYLLAIHNQGNASAIQGHRAVEEGLKKGVPDICLPISYSYYLDDNDPETVQWHSGLYIELKRKQLLTEGKRKATVVARQAGKASTEQEDWQTFLREQGYVCEICYGFDEARNLIIKYLREGGLI